MSSPIAGTFKWKHCLARAMFGARNDQMSIVNADPVIIVSKNVRPVGRSIVDTKRRIFYGLNWKVTYKKITSVDLIHLIQYELHLHHSEQKSNANHCPEIRQIRLLLE